MLRAQDLSLTGGIATVPPLAAGESREPSVLPLPRLSTALLIALLTLDVLLILGHVAFFAFRLEDGRLLLSYEPGYGEIFQYAKFFGLATVLVTCAIFARQFRWLSWALVFLFLGLDDAFYLHETFGRRWRDAGREFGFRTQDIFELIFSAAVGTLLLGAVALAWRRGDELFRRLNRRLLLALLALAAVGVGVDIVHEHTWVQARRWLHHTLGLVEDGGELLVVSVMAWIVAGTLSESRRPPQ
jgi:hypothetical protein